MPDHSGDDDLLTDSLAIELIVDILGRREQWSSDEIADIADVIRRARPTLGVENYHYPQPTQLDSPTRGGPMTSSLTPSQTIEVDEERFVALLEYLSHEDALPRFETYFELSEIHSFIQEMLGANVECCLTLPEGADAVAYFFNDDDPGFVFGLRPKTLPEDEELQLVNVTGLHVEARHIEPRDPEGRLIFDGGTLTTVTFARDVAKNVAANLNALVPAYHQLFVGRPLRDDRDGRP